MEVKETHPSLERASIDAIQRGLNVTYKEIVKTHTIDIEVLNELIAEFDKNATNENWDDLFTQFKKKVGYIDN